MNVVVGIDPGANGAMCVMEAETRRIIAVQNHGVNHGREKIVSLLHVTRQAHKVVRVIIERVHSSPQMGVVSAFSFGENFGWWCGVLNSLGLAFDAVPPQSWMTALGCLTGGDKGVTKRKAETWFADSKVKVTLANADAILIAVYASRVCALAPKQQGGV